MKLGGLILDGGLGRNRTGMPSRAADFESTASTCFATRPNIYSLLKASYRRITCFLMNFKIYFFSNSFLLRIVKSLSVCKTMLFGATE